MRDYLSRTEYLYLRKAILGMFGVAILVMTVWTAYAPAQTTDLNGKWTITWSGSTKTNTVTWPKSQSVSR